MMFLCCLLVLVTYNSCLAQSIKHLQTDERVIEGKTVNLSCRYDGSADSLHWYRQYPGSKPEFLLLIYPSSTKSVTYADPRVPRLDGEVKDKHVYLEISSVSLSDSALYYCAMEPTTGFKMFFGNGTKLVIKSKEVQKPSFYKVTNDSCLATDFTQHNALDGEPAFSGQNISVRYDGEKTYSAFALGAGRICTETEGCKEGSSGQTVEVESDEKMNFMSLGIFWLRIVFLKTVVFNVLMTVKAWMS